jgi:hypothetical protein
MEIDANTGAVTVKVVLLEVIVFADAVMKVMPWVREEATPLLFNVATPVSLDAQVTEPEILPVLPFEKVPVAVKVTGKPLGVAGVPGLIAIAVITAAVTVKPAVGEVILLAVAVTVVLPSATPVATPVALLMLATPGLADSQIT